MEFEDAVFGTEAKVTVRRHETCEECRGSGAAPGKRRLPAVRATAVVRSAISRLFQYCARLPDCQGTGNVVTDPCVKCKVKAGCCVKERWTLTFQPA